MPVYVCVCMTHCILIVLSSSGLLIYAGRDKNRLEGAIDGTGCFGNNTTELPCVQGKYTVFLPFKVNDKMSFLSD